MTEQNIFPTRWPIFDFHLAIWKLSIFTELFRPSQESMTYEYILLFVMWNGKEIYRFRLYNTYNRREEQTKEMIRKHSGYEYEIKELEEIRDKAEEEIKRLKKV